MFYRCRMCGVVFFFTPKEVADGGYVRINVRPCVCRAPDLQEIHIEADSRSNTYTEAGGEIEGIETATSIAFDLRDSEDYLTTLLKREPKSGMMVSTE